MRDGLGLGLADTWGTPPGRWNPPPPPKQEQPVRVWGWSAMDATGERRRGQMEARERDEVVAKLRAVGLSSIRVRRAFPALALSRLRWWVTERDRHILAVLLRTMLQAGLPADVSFAVLEKQSPPPVARRLRALRRALDAGTEPSSALAESGNLFAVDVLAQPSADVTEPR